MATVLLCDSIRKKVGKGNLVGAIFLDLSRAFDTFNHANLITHLISYGISGTEIEWFKDYLFHRTQVVDIDGVHSKWKTGMENCKRNLWQKIQQFWQPESKQPGGKIAAMEKTF